MGVPQPPQPEQWSGIAGATTLAELPIYGSERLGLMRPNVLRDTAIDITREYSTRRVDQKEYELKDHLGNVRVVVSDMKTRIQDLEQTPLPPATFELRVKSVNAYYAFGMLAEGMSGSSEGYRYGFQGQEMDNEINGVGKLYTAEYWEYDSRLGRRWNLDPKDSPSNSPYSTFSGNPILFSDPNGDTVKIEYQTGFFLFRWLGLGSTEQTNYVDGKLYNDEGKEQNIDYESGSVDDFLGKTVGALDEIRGVAIGQETLTELQASLNIVVIRSGLESKSVAIDGGAAALHERLLQSGENIENVISKSKAEGISNSGSGSFIKWNVAGTAIPTLAGMQKNGIVALFHELSHSLDAIRGLSNETVEAIGVARGEWQAVYRENIFRQQMNLPLREYYEKTIDRLGREQGSGPRMLTPDNLPLRPIWYPDSNLWY